MDADSHFAVGFALLIGIATAYLFFVRNSHSTEELSAGDLRDFRARRLEQEQSQRVTAGALATGTHQGNKESLQNTHHPTLDGIVKNQVDPLASTNSHQKGATRSVVNDEARLKTNDPKQRATPSPDTLEPLPCSLESKIDEAPSSFFDTDSRPSASHINDSTARHRVLDHDSPNRDFAHIPNVSSRSHTESLDGLSPDMAPNKRRKAQPAIQDLCQELSEAFSVCVRPTLSPGSEWNGTEGWEKSTRSLPSKTSSSILELPFASYEQQIASNDDAWERLYQSLEAMSRAETNIIVPGKLSMQWVAKAHGKLRTAGRPELARCLKLVHSWIFANASIALEAEINDDQEDQDIPGLFADEVNDGQESSSELLDQLIAMMENFSIASPLVDAIVENSSRPEALMDHVLGRLMERLKDDAFSGFSVLDTLSRRLERINAVGHFMQCKTVQKHVADFFSKEFGSNGREAEKNFPMNPLFRLAAYTLPETVPGLQNESFLSVHFEDALAAQSTICAEVAVFSRKGVKGHDQFQRQSRQLMESARAVCRTVVEKSMRVSKGCNKGKVFQWLMRLAELNHPLTKLLASDLLSSDGMVAVSSSWPFLNGLATSLVSICVNRLRDEFEKKKLSAFDQRFLASEGFRAICFESSGLSQSSMPQETLSNASSFDGTTKFFFVVSCVLHASLYPMMRVEGSFRTHYNKPLLQLQAMAEDPHSSTGFKASPVTKVAVRGWIGWSTFLDDPAVVQDMVSFALLQLQWLLELVMERSNPDLANVPDWLCKEPARWLTHVAAGRRSLFVPHQAQLTIELATRLLAAGNVTGECDHGTRNAQFSPVVLAELIHVVSAFVRSGIRKATKRGNSKDGTSSVDERSLYLSLDRNNLSTYVYTNELVATELCPVLMTTFQVLDHVEGLNVDAEASFDKYSVKSEISRLLLILWCHPYDNRCKNSMIAMAEADLSKFVASVALVVGMLFDDGHQRFVDVCKSLLKRRLTQQEKAFMERQKDRATNAFASSRSFLLLLWKLCLDPRMAAIMGGTEEAARDLAAMITTVLGLTVQSDGALLGEIDTVPLPNRSADILKRVEQGEFEPPALRRMVSTLVSHRRSVKKEYGLDVPLLACTLLAIAAQSTEGCLKAGQHVSPLVESLAGQDDCDVQMLRALVSRYFPGGKKMNSVEEDILRQDGSVGTDVWAPEPSENKSTLSGPEKHRQSNAARDHTSLEEIQNNVSRESVLRLLNAIEAAKRDVDDKRGLNGVKPDVALCQLSAPMTQSDDKDYTESLSDWVVSSHSFCSGNEDGGSLSHAFDHNLKTSATTAPGKVLVKEARKCHKNIPAPHPNSAVYVCFAEERMDICRCLITGPVDTPYAFGAFEFDVFFPSSYPNIPPLVQFMTTGGGRVRFGPNLYLDGKVCLSLLGTFNAQDQSQQWNPKESSLPQVLLSIQTQLLTEDPYFNEPGHETMRHTSAGQEASRSYNLKRSLDTLRYAVIQPLTDPTVGFEEITFRHFALCRQQIVAQARRWMLEAKGTELEKRFDAVFDRLVVALHNLPNAIKSKYHPLPPREEDLRVLRSKGDTLFSQMQAAQKAEAALTLVQTTLQNPWVSSNTTSATSGPQSGGMGDADIEDFYS